MIQPKSPLVSTMLIGLLVLATSAATLASDPGNHFMKIKVVHNYTGQPIPLAQVRTQQTSGVSFFTDSRGVAAVHVPGLMGKTTGLNVFSFGYNFHIQKVRLVAGASMTLRMNPFFDIKLAERMYRLTGGGIYRNSEIFGEPSPIENPLINANVLTHGPMTSTVFGGELVWFFSSTGTPSGRGDGTSVSGATSNLRDSGGLNPARGVDLDYLTDSTGSARSLLPNLGGDTVTLKSLMAPPVHPPRLYAHFEAETKNGVVRGLLRWDASKKQFRLASRFPDNARIKLCSNVSQIRADGREWFYFACPLPLVRVPADPAAMKDISRYETLTPLEAGASWEGKKTERTQGNRWEWKTGTPTVDHPREQTLRRNFWFPNRAGIHHFYDFHAAEPFTARQGTVHWNHFREKWIMITNEIVRKGPERGNVFYAEADSPIGPWAYARKITTHGDWLRPPHQEPFSFLDVTQHPYFTRDDGKTVFFSGLFKHRTGGTPVPRYNNNHLMYRIDLRDRRLHLPTPVYMNRDPNGGFTYGTARSRSNEQQDSGLVPFYAYDVDRHGVSGNSPRFNHLDGKSHAEPVPVWQEIRHANGEPMPALTTHPSPNVTSDTPLFYAWPSDFNREHEKLTDLLEYRHPTESTLIYVTERLARSLENGGWHFGGRVARVWKSPRMDPPTDASARPIRNWQSSIDLSSRSGSGGSSGGGCLIERRGVPTSRLRTVRDRLLPTALGRWVTARYYTL